MPSPHAFPGIEVLSIETEDSLNGDDLSQRIMNAGADITPEVIADRLGPREALVYNLQIRASSESLARKKAKFFVRAKNPFEPSLVTVSYSEQVEEGYPRTYRVHVGVNK